MERDGPNPGLLQADVLSGEDAHAKLGVLINRTFNLPEGTHFLDDFPIWDERFAPEPAVRLGVFNGQDLVASTGIRLAQLKAPHGSITVALLGAVATDEKWRGKGLASQLVSFAVQWAEQRGATAILLWGSEYDLYRKLGFELCGVQYRVPLTGLSLPACELEVGQAWQPAIAQQLQKRPSGLALQDSDSKWLAAHKNVQWFWTGRADAPTAYVAYGRGVDLNGLIHEWGGQPEHLLQLLSHVRTKFPEAQVIGTRDLLEQHGFALDTNEPEFVCMATVINPVRIFDAYHPEVPFTSKLELERWTLKSGDETISGLDSGDLARVLFGPQNEHRFLSEYLPLPLWLWGLDGV